MFVHIVCVCVCVRLCYWAQLYMHGWESAWENISATVMQCMLHSNTNAYMELLIYSRHQGKFKLGINHTILETAW